MPLFVLIDFKSNEKPNKDHYSKRYLAKIKKKVCPLNLRIKHILYVLTSDKMILILSGP